MRSHRVPIHAAVMLPSIAISQSMTAEEEVWSFVVGSLMALVGIAVVAFMTPYPYPYPYP